MTPARLALLAGLVAAHLLATGWLTPHGHLNVDECTYHLMSRAAAQGTLEFRNGYDEFSTRELVWVTVVPHEERLYPVTPPIYAAIAMPFYAALGFSGLFWMNALAFLAVLALTARFAQQLFDDWWLSNAAVAVLAFATYLWEYSQAAWPHTLSTLSVLGALSVGWSALQADSERQAWRAGILSGLLLGFGMGIRLDVALAIPAVLLPFLFMEGRRPRAGFAVALGCLPPLVLLAFINHLKFGIASPLSYGPSVSPAGEWTRYLPVAGLGILLVAACWAAQRPAIVAWLRPRWVPVAIAATATLIAALALPELRAVLLRLCRGVATLLFDLRALPEGIVRPALSRSAGDGLVYFGHLKKAWVQSLPYLGLLVLPAAAAFRGHADRGRLALLALVPAAHVAAFGYFAWDGGMSLNLRYLTPALPAVAILTAWALRDLGMRGAAASLGLGAWCGAALFFALSAVRRGTPDAMELFVLDAPLVLAALLVVSATGLLLRGHAWFRPATRALAAAALVWASLTAFAYDYAAVRWLRGYNGDLSRTAARLVAPDSILFTTHPDPFCGLLDQENVRVALPSRDRYRDFRPLADFHLAAGRPVFAALPEAAWRMLERSGRLDGLAVEPLHEHPVFSIRGLRD